MILGYYFDLFDFSIKDVLIVSVMNITLYLLVYLVDIAKTKYYADSINAKLNERMYKGEK